VKDLIVNAEMMLSLVAERFEAGAGMARNIVIFSDGTGQRGGVSMDERRSNIYKLYRATRCGPDTAVDPAEQLTFYDPGLGTLPPNSDLGLIGTLWRNFYNLASQATGLGLTGNIIDCYAAIVQLWRPGDRIFLFGFSRGAYTVRCLGAVLCLCGVPTRGADGKLLRRNDRTVKGIAKEAVKKVYQHTASKQEKDAATDREKELLKQRRVLASEFRQRYGSADPADAAKANVYPYFVGVFDTVASLANPFAVAGLTLLALLVLAIPSAIVAYFSARFWPTFWIWFTGLSVASLIIGGIIHTLMRVRSEIGLEVNKNWRPFHFTEPRMKFYDLTLNPNVKFARHAISIDEARSSFQRVGWGGAGNHTTNFQQIWFSGSHSDIGGSYLENESRLSDISLKWMLDAAVVAGLKYDPTLLRLYPDPTGPQHDEAKGSIFRFAGTKPRRVGHDFPLHPSVVERFKAAEVLNYDTLMEYRPENLKEHDQVKEYYKPKSP
jgi:uncharacterized protein (DUF2235 family)